MNIAIFTNNYLPNPYGVSTSVEGFRRSLVKKGHTVYVFAPRWFDDDVYDVEEEEKNNIFRYPAVKVPTKIDFSLVVPYSASIDEKIENIDFDVIHAQHPNLLGGTAKRWAQKKNVPLVFTWHSLYDRYAHYMPFVPEKISAHLAMRNAAAFARESDHVIVPTEAVLSIAEDAGVARDRISVVTSGIDEDLFAEPDGKKIREKYNIGDDAIVLVTISRLTEEKNVLFLAQQVSRVLKDDDAVIFLCVGEGDQGEEMRDIFEKNGVVDRVVFTGKSERGDVKDYLVAGDIFVYASTSETQGTIVTENMYAGRPIVGVDMQGVSSLIEHEVTGLKTAEDDTFSTAVKHLVNSKDLREQYGKNAYTIAREKYTADICTESLIRVYEKVIANHC